MLAFRTSATPKERALSEQPAEQNIEADQVVVNNAPDGGGVDNNEAPAAESTEGGDSSE